MRTGTQTTAVSQEADRQNLSERQLRQELARSPLSLGFEDSLEEAFRTTLRADRRVPRMLFYLFPILLFGTAPLYGPALLHTPENLIPLFRALEFGVLLPLCVLAAVVDFLPVSLRFSRAVHTVAVLALWTAVLLLRRASLSADFYFPLTILGIFMMGSAVLCGFRYRRTLLGILLFTGLGFINEFTHPLPRPAPELWMDGMVLVLMAALAIVGTWFNEGLYRRLWLQSRLVEISARTDALTGLNTRAEFNRRFAQLFAQARREQRSLVVMMLDVDRFKQINDRYGHLYGDEVLRAVGESVSDTSARRPLDIVARYGGEELVVVWYDMPPESINQAASRVLDRIRGIRLPAPDGSEAPPVSASAGVAQLVPDEGRSPEQVLHIADMLMYTAKREGRDRYCLQAFEQGQAQS